VRGTEHLSLGGNFTAAYALQLAREKPAEAWISARSFARGIRAATAGSSALNLHKNKTVLLFVHGLMDTRLLGANVERSAGRCGFPANYQIWF